MKKILTSALLSLSVLVAGAQDMYYAKMLSQNNYYGTARSIAMGNAMTALGSDLGSIGINPAGSAVTYYNQFTITPGVTIATTNTGYSPEGPAGSFSWNREIESRMQLPNIGATMVFDTGQSSGLMSMCFGFISNNTSSYLRYSTGLGQNSRTSFLGNMAAAATGYTDSQLCNEKQVNGDMFASYAGNQFGEFGLPGSGCFAGSNQAVDPTDSYCYVPGVLNQRSMTNTYGSKSDIILNAGFNISDRFYFGFNIGIPRLEYNRQDIFYESAVDSDKFPVIFSYFSGGTEVKDPTNYMNSSNTYMLSTKADGIYAKFGFIALVTGNLRVGAAIQTPSAMTLTERWQYKSNSTYAKSKYDTDGWSTPGEYSYSLTTPYIFNAGVAYTFPFGLVSADYELTDYSIMEYGELHEDGFNTAFFGQNSVCGKFCGLSHALRLGAEVWLGDCVTVRAGYNLLTDPERYWFTETGEKITADNYLDAKGNPRAYNLVSSKYVGRMNHSFSAGLGYASYGAFFADIAFRFTKMADCEFAPYYYTEYQAVDKNGHSIPSASPIETIRHNLLDVALTIGWKF